jgi:hypothetical protein
MNNKNNKTMQMNQEEYKWNIYGLFCLGLVLGVAIGLIASGVVIKQPKPTNCFYDFDISYQCQQKVSAVYPNATAFLTPDIVNDQKEWLCCFSRSQPYDFGCMYSVRAC